VHYLEHIYKNKNVDVITIPNYVKIKIPEPSTGSNYTPKKGTLLKIKDEIKLLYIKNQNWYKQLYYRHIKRG
jgi:hypothetical protein